jgi:hypothetical protein
VLLKNKSFYIKKTARPWPESHKPRIPWADFGGLERSEGASRAWAYAKELAGFV